MSKWVIFSKEGTTGKTDIYCILTKDPVPHTLGFIKWYGPWRQYCFFPNGNTIFEPTCLKDITAFLAELMLKRKQQSQNKKTNQL